MNPIERLDWKKTTRIRDKAAEALRDSDLTQVFEIAGVDGGYETASAALKAVLAERLVECTLKAMKEAKRRKMRLGAAAIIIAANK